MTRLYFTKFHFTIIVVIIALTFAFICESSAQKTMASISGRVLDGDGKPIPDLKLGIKPVKFGMHIDLKQRTPFSSWLRVMTDKEGRFFFPNIDPVSSQFVMFPEHGSEFELISIGIGDLTFYSIAFRRAMPTWFGKLTFAVEPGEHLENVILNVKTPRMRIRGRVLFEDGTPLVNEKIGLSISRRREWSTATGSGSSSGGMRRNFETDNEGYFVTYSQNNAATYIVSMNYKGFFAESEPIILEEGERYDDLVFTLKDIKRMKAREAVWVVNSVNGNGYKKIFCNSWNDAQTKAKAEGAYLVAINDKAEQEWLEGLFPENAFYWIGLYVPEKGSSWQWVNKQPLTYENWRMGQKPDIMDSNGEKIGVTMEFSAKKWMAIGSNSPFLSAIKQAILEKDKIHFATPDAKK